MKSIDSLQDEGSSGGEGFGVPDVIALVVVQLWLRVRVRDYGKTQFAN